MAADLMDERHDCGADAPQGAEYTPDGTLCVQQMQTKCARSAFGGNRTSENFSLFPHIVEACPSTTTESISPARNVDISQRIDALDALASKLLLVQDNPAYRPIADKRADGCATPPVGDIMMPPALDDDTGLYTPLDPSDSTPTQKLEYTYQIPCSPSESPDYRLPTKAPKFTNAPERGAVNATEPSEATACKGASDDPTKKCSIRQSNFPPSGTIFIAPQQDTKRYIATLTKECSAQSSDAQGFPDTCAPTSTSGQRVGNDDTEIIPGDLAVPCAASIVDLATADDVWYECSAGGREAEYEEVKASYPTEFGHADAVVISAENGFLDGGASRYAPPICIPISLQGEASPESPASMYYTPQTQSFSGSPTFSDTSTLIDPVDTLINNDGKCHTFNSPAPSNVPSLHHTSAQPATELSEESYRQDEQTSPVDTTETVCHERLNQDTIRSSLSDNTATPSIEITPSQRKLGHILPEELFREILSHMLDVTFWRRISLPTSEDYRDLGYISLTCRYWAKQVRFILLDDLYIRSTRDVRRMKIVLHPPPQFQLKHPASLIRKLRLVSSDSNHAWIHMASKIFEETPELARNAVMALTLTEYRPHTKSSTHCPRSIYYYLPITRPVFYRQIYQLFLKDVTFAQAGDLFHLISELYNLRRLILDGVSWDPSSPYTIAEAMPPQLHHLMVYETDRFGHDGRGLLSWIMAKSLNFSPPRKPDNGPPLPSLLRRPHWECVTLPPSHPSQCGYILELLDIFSHPDVSSIIESPQEIMWDMSRSPGADAATLYIKGRQRFPGESFNPSVTPHLMFELKRKGGGLVGHDRLYVTRIVLSARSFNPTIQELLLYDWKTFIDTTTRFEHLELVEMCFPSREQTSRMFQDHQSLIKSIVQAKPALGHASYRFLYRTDGESRLEEEKTIHL